MPPSLSPARLIEAGEIGARLHPLDRAVAVLRLADAASVDPAQLPIAARDRQLAQLRHALFGDPMPCLVDCPVCAAPLEFDLSASDVAAALADPQPETLYQEGWEIMLRPLDSHDLAAAVRAVDLAASADMLLRRAVASVSGPRGETTFDALPAPVALAVEARVAEREGAGEIMLDLNCEGCGKGWTTTFDIGLYLWAEIDTARRRLIAEIATLAARFGWSEADLLAMTPERRHAYLHAEAIA